MVNEKQLQNETNALVAIASELVIFSAEDNIFADKHLKKIMVGKKAITEYWRVPIDNANKVHKELTRKRNEMLKPLTVEEQLTKDKISGYLTKEREEREKIERELREAAQKKEALRLAEVALKEKELKEAEDYLSPEQIAEEKRKIEEANKKEFTPQVIIERETLPSGQISKERFSVEIIDINIVPRKYLLPDMQTLNALARAEKDRLSIPGVKVIKKISVETRQ